MEKFCYDCKKHLPLSEFFKNKSTKDGYQSICKNCSAVRRQKFQKDHPEKMQEYAKAHWYKYRVQKLTRDRIRMNARQVFLDTLKTPCAKCGESRVWMIQFHHKNPAEKEFSIADGSKLHKSKEDVLHEVNKCVCLCANCHKEFHYLYGQKPLNPVEDINKYLNGGDGA